MKSIEISQKTLEELSDGKTKFLTTELTAIDDAMHIAAPVITSNTITCKANQTSKSQNGSLLRKA